MIPAQDESQRYVSEKTRHIVGRTLLSRASRIIQAWQAEEQQNKRLSGHLALAALFIAVSGGILLYLFR